MSRRRPSAVCRRGHGAFAARGVTLIELLSVVVIGTVVMGALLLTWFALSRSYALTTSSSDAREFARDAVARLARELRDSEPDGTSPALREVSPDEIIFTTTFNDSDNDLPGSQPLLTRYWYEYDEASGTGLLHRQRDTDRDGKLFEAGVQDPGDRDMVVVRDLLNTRSVGEDGELHADIFRFTFTGADAALMEDESWVPAVSVPAIFLVNVSLSVDLNPQKAPEPMHLSTTVQLRNQSRF